MTETKTPSFADIQQEIANILDIPDDQLDEEQKAAVDLYLDELATQEAHKVDAFAQFVKIQSGLADACKEEAKRLSSKAKTIENNLAWLKHHYQGVMETRGLKKVKGEVYTLSLRKSESVLVEDMDALEKMPIFVRTKTIVEPDKAKIKESIKAGEIVPGCQLVENYSLQIR